MKAKATPTLRELKKLLDYNPNTGVFKWLAGPREGKIAGHIKEDGYRTIVIKGKHYQAHRLAWVFSGKKLPDFVGHKNLKRDDNRIKNLIVSPRCPRKTNKSSLRNSKRA